MATACHAAIPFRQMIPLHEAQEMVLAGCTPLTPVQVVYSEMTGRVLAQDVVATEDVPPFSNTAVDGYAVRATDAEQVPVELRVVDTLAAGAEKIVTISAIECISGLLAWGGVQDGIANHSEMAQGGRSHIFEGEFNILPLPPTQAVAFGGKQRRDHKISRDQIPCGQRGSNRAIMAFWASHVGNPKCGIYRVIHLLKNLPLRAELDVQMILRF